MRRRDRQDRRARRDRREPDAASVLAEVLPWELVFTVAGAVLRFVLRLSALVVRILN